jgi:signal recognition particle receptor subunit alpha
VRLVSFFLEAVRTDYGLLSSEAPKKGKGATPKKQQRKWGDQPVTESDMATLDYSMPASGNGASPEADLGALVDKSSLGTRTKDGMYEVKDWEFAIAESLNSTSAAKANGKEDDQPTGVLGSLFARLTGGKVLTEADLKPVLEGMKQHLMKKNVAMDIADKVCEGVGEGLVGKKVGGFQSKFFSTRPAIRV